MGASDGRGEGIWWEETNLISLFGLDWSTCENFGRFGIKIFIGSMLHAFT
jgi:hypothetical protein